MTQSAVARMGTLLMLLALALPLSPRALAADTPKAPTALKVGDAAPDFTLDYFDGNDIKKLALKDFKGKKNVVLAFYVFAFTGG